MSCEDKSKWELDLSSGAIKWKERTLKAYNENVDRLKTMNEAKPDMQTYKALKDKHTPEDTFGHIRGVKPGDRFNGRGELAILGLHKKILAGIDCKASEERGAYAIVLSGGYKDDADEGTTFWYTGQGGQGKGGVQVSDQKWLQGNLALRQSCESETPVRVFRGVMEEGKRIYVYDGLYNVKESKMEPSKDGPLVCKFLMVGLNSQSQASAKVEFGALGGVSIRGVQHGRVLAAPGATVRRNKKAMVAETTSGCALARAARLKSLSERKGVLALDISQGQEKIPIPLFNETNNGIGPPDVDYISDYIFAAGSEELVKDILKEQTALFLNDYMEGSKCALEFNRRMVKRDEDLPPVYEPYRRTFPDNYNPNGLLLSTDSFGVIECGDSCGKKCKNNKRVAKGIQLPLEVYMTEKKGWGVRCDADIASGEYICSYIGELITEATAEERSSNDQYLFELNHFATIFDDMDQLGREAFVNEVPEYKIPPCPPRKLNSRVAEKSAMLQKQRKLKEEGKKIKGVDLAPSSPAEQEVVDKTGASRRVERSPSVILLDSSSDPQDDKASTSPDVVAVVATVRDEDRKAKAGRAGVLLDEDGDVIGSNGSSDNTKAPIVADLELASPACSEERPAVVDDEADQDVEAMSGREMKAGNFPASPRSSEEVTDLATDCIKQDGKPDLQSVKEQPADRSPDHHSPDFDTLLVVDAAKIGNVARYINHSCDGGNLVVQPVLTGRCKNVFYYYISLFSARDIRRGEELTYNYSEKYKGMSCQCGAPGCRGVLTGQ